MANIKLGGTTAISESSGAITVPALGTVTSGNISNSAIVYPSGHCIQCKQHTTDTEVSGNATSWDDAFVCPSFTPVSLVLMSEFMILQIVLNYVGVVMLLDMELEEQMICGLLLL
jgi:Ca2+/Na+ antiporter